MHGFTIPSELKTGNFIYSFLFMLDALPSFWFACKWHFDIIGKCGCLILKILQIYLLVFDSFLISLSHSASSLLSLSELFTLNFLLHFTLNPEQWTFVWFIYLPRISPPMSIFYLNSHPPPPASPPTWEKKTFSVWGAKRRMGEKWDMGSQLSA